MPISILELSRKPEGTQETRAIHFDTLEDIELATPVEGEVEITVVSPHHFSTQAQIHASVVRECDRCLQRYNYPVSLSLFADFVDTIEEGDWPIVQNMIDLAPAVRDEILLSLPYQSLHSPDCKGISGNTN